jgi:tetratricopeptide (TPR) repeat protein
MTVEQLLEEAKMLRKTWRYKEALSSYEDALECASDYLAAHYGRCKMLRALSRRKEALVAYDELLQLDPASASAYVGKAWVLVDLKRYKEALATFDHALRLDPSFGKAVSGKRFVLAHLHRDKEAEGLADPESTRTARQQLAAQECITAEDYYAQANALFSLDQKDEAMRAFEHCIRLDPLYLDAYERISTIHLVRDEQEQSLAIYNRVLQAFS